MKRIITILAVAVSSFTMAQSPNLMSYQAVVRDGSNNLVTSTAVGMQISILQGSTSGTAVFVETHTPTSNANGLVSVEIGNGTNVSGDISTIDWSTGPYFLKTETDPTGGTTYSITGTTQLLSVPYAFHAGTVENDLDEQTLSISGQDLTISGGNTITLPAGTGGDDWGAQVVQSDATLSGDGTTGNELTVVGDLTDDQTLSLSGTDLSISGGNTIDVSSLQDGVTDADADPSNEIQDISLSGTDLSITSGSTVDLSTIQDGTGTDSQTLSFTSPNLSISGGNSVDLSGLQDGVTDADADPANEIQDLSSVLTEGNDAGGSNIVNTGSIGVGTATPNSSAALEVNSTSQGFLPPVMTDTQRDAIASPAAGLMIFNSTTGCMNYFNGSNWNSVCGDVIYAAGSGMSSSTANTDCQQILTDFPSSLDGTYWIDPDGAGGNSPFQCYCDMTTSGGGWTLVMLNNSGVVNPAPSYNDAINSVTVNGSLGSLTSFDMLVGLSNWALIGTQVIYEVGTDPNTIANAAQYDISLNAGNNYELSLSNEMIIAGGTSPGFFTYHPGYQFSAFNVDNDVWGGSCSQNYGNSAWWYGACWSGSIWGNNNTDGPHWTGSAATPHTWGAIWIR